MTCMDTWLLLIVMSLATYRITRLITKDSFPPVRLVRDRLAGDYREQEEHDRHIPVHHTADDGTPWVLVERAEWSPYWLAELVSCPWCASGWVSMGVTTAVALTVGLPAPLLAWPAVWAAGALLAAQRWS